MSPYTRTVGGPVLLWRSGSSASIILPRHGAVATAPDAEIVGGLRYVELSKEVRRTFPDRNAVRYERPPRAGRGSFASARLTAAALMNCGRGPYDGNDLRAGVTEPGRSDRSGMKCRCWATHRSMSGGVVARPGDRTREAPPEVRRSLRTPSSRFAGLGRVAEPPARAIPVTRRLEVDAVRGCPASSLIRSASSRIDVSTPDARL